MKIGKSIFAILLSSFIGIMANPEILMASDSVAVTGIANTGVESVIISEPEPILMEQVAVAPVGYTNTVNSSVIAPVSTPAPVVALPSNYIQVGGKIVALNNTGSLSENADYHSAVAWFYTGTGKFIYAHNSAEAFAGINGLNTFTVVRNGVSTSYRVAKVQSYDCKMVAGSCRLQLNGRGNYSDIDIVPSANTSYQEGRTRSDYDIALQTCEGSGRVIVFANRI